MTNHRVEKGRRKFLLTVAGGIAGLAAESMPTRVLAQPAGGPPLSISTIGARERRRRTWRAFRQGGASRDVFVPPT